MPCYTVVLQSVAIEVSNPDLLKAAVESMPGWQILNQSERMTSIRTASGGFIELDHEQKKAEVERRDIYQIDALKVAYSQQIIRHVNKKYGWALKQTGERAFQGTKRGF